MANKTSEPLNPVTQAKQLARCIESGMDPRKLAEFGFAQGANVRQFVLACALMPAAELAQKFRDDPEAWRHMEPVQDRLMPFLEAFIVRAGELAAQLKAKDAQPPAAAPELIANPGEATSSPAAAGETAQPPKKPAFGQFDPIAGRRVP